MRVFEISLLQDASDYKYNDGSHQKHDFISFEVA